MATPDNNDIDVVGAKKSVGSQLSFLKVFRIILADFELLKKII